MKKRLSYSPIYLVPLILLTYQLRHNILTQYIIFDLIGISLLVYTNISMIKNEKFQLLDEQKIVRKLYFCFSYFFIIFITPFILNNNTLSIGNMDPIISTYLLIVIIIFIIYISIISNNSISEISFGTASVKMVKEQIKEGLNEQINLTEVLLDKITAEYRIIQNLSEYCRVIYDALVEKKEFEVSKVFEDVLKKYFSYQKEHISVIVVDEIKDMAKENYSMSKKQYQKLKLQMDKNQPYIIKMQNLYYLFLSFEYNELSHERVFVVLSSEKQYINEETYFILNILKELYDKLLFMVNIEFPQEE